ncbi:unnamed protein product, partial [Urochloa humidicola]
PVLVFPGEVTEKTVVVRVAAGSRRRQGSATRGRNPFAAKVRAFLTRGQLRNYLLRRCTAALQVRVEPLDPNAVGGRVAAAVLGPVGPVRRAEASFFSAEPLALSPAQEALVAVIDAEGALHRRGREGEKGPRRVMCLLLVEADRLQEVTGRGVLERVALETGAVVRVMPWEEVGSPPQGSHPRRSWRENNATHDHVIFRL